MKEIGNAGKTGMLVSKVSKIPISLKSLGTKRALAVFLAVLVTASALVVLVNNNATAELEVDPVMPDYYITYHYSTTENSPSYTFGYYGIASTEYNPEVWASTEDPELWSKNGNDWEQQTNTDLINWTGPSTGSITVDSITTAVVQSDQMYFELKDGKRFFYYYDPASEEADKLEKVDLTNVEIKAVGNNPYVLFKMTISDFDSTYGVVPLDDKFNWGGSNSAKFSVVYKTETNNGTTTITACYCSSSDAGIGIYNGNGKMPLAFNYKQKGLSISSITTNKVFGGWTNLDGSEFIYPGDVIAKPSSGDTINLYAVWIEPDAFPQTSHASVDKETASYPIITAGVQFSNYKDIGSLETSSDGKTTYIDSNNGFYFNSTKYVAYVSDHSQNKSHNGMFSTIYHLIGNNTIGELHLSSGTYRGTVDCTKPILTVYNINDDVKVVCDGDVVIDSLGIDQKYINKDNRKAEKSKASIIANYHRLIIGTGIDTINTATDGNKDVFLHAPLVLGAESGLTSGTGLGAKTIVSDNDKVHPTVNIATYVIIHSGTYGHVSAGTISGTIGSSSSPLSTYLVIKKATVMGVVSGTNGGSHVQGVSDGNRGEDTNFLQGGTFIYAYGLDTAGDTYEDKATGHELPSYKKIDGTKGNNYKIDENCLIYGGSYNGNIKGSTHIFLTGKSSVYDVQAGARNCVNNNICDNTYLEMSGKAEVRHVACGTITDGSSKNVNVADHVRIVVGGNVKVATLLGAGYDTWTISSCVTMQGGTIDIKINGGEIGYVYGGSMRGSIGTKDKPVDITITMTGGTVKFDLFGGGRGGLDKIHHSADSSKIGYPGRWDGGNSIGTFNIDGQPVADTVGYSKVYGSVTINMSGGLIEGNVYGGGESIPAVDSYFGKGLDYYQPIKDKSPSYTGPNEYVASVTGDILINVTGSAKVLKDVYGAGKGIKTDSSGNVILDYVEVYDAGDVIPNQITSIPYYSANMIYSDGGYRFIPWVLPKDAVGTNGVTTEIEYKSFENYDYYAQLTGDTTVVLVEEENGEVVVSGSVFGGGGYSKIKGNTTVELDSVTVNSDVFAGGLGTANKVSTEGQRTIWVRGDANIKGSVYGGSQFGIDGSVIINIETNNTDPDVLNKLNRNKSVVVIEKGTIEGSVFGGGLMGKTYGNTGVYVGYKLPDINTKTPVPNNYAGLSGIQISIDSVFAGGNVSTGTSDTDVQDAYTQYLVQGSGLVEVYGSTNNMISINGSIMGSGNACLTRGTTEIDLSSLYNAGELTGIHRADTVIIDNSLIKVKGRSPITPVFGQDKVVSLYKIKTLILKNGSSVAIDNPIDDIGALYSYTADNKATTVTAPLNRIVFTSGSTMYIRSENSSGTPSYSEVVGYVLMTTTQSEYGAYAIGLESNNGGFSVTSEGTMKEADTSKTDGVCIWFISGVSKKVLTLELMSTGSDSVRVSKESFVTVSKFQSDTEMVFTGGVFTKMSNNADGDPYTFVRPGADSMEDNRAQLSLALGYYKKASENDTVTLYDPTYRQMAISGDNQSSVQGTFFKKDSKESDASGEEKNRSLISVPMQYAGNSSRTSGEFRIYMTLAGLPLDGTSYVGYLTLNFQEIKMVSYGAVGEGGEIVDTPRSLVANTVEVRVDIYIYGSASATVEQNNAFTVEIKTEENKGVHSGEASTLIPQAYSMAEMTLKNVTVIGAGSGSMATQLLTENYLIPDCEFIAPEGKSFDHWKISDGTHEIIGYPGQILTVTGDTARIGTGQQLTVSSGITMVPIWTSERLQIVFDPNGGTVGTGNKIMSTPAVEYDTVYKLPECDFVAPANKIFAHWSVTMGNKKSVDRDAGEIITITGDTVVKAVWTDKKTITFQPGNNGAGDSVTIEWAVNERYTLPDVGSEFLGRYGDNLYGYHGNTGYYFVTWSVKVGSSDSVEKSPGESVKIKDDTIITAKWSNGLSFSVSFVVSGGDQDGKVMYSTNVASGSKFLLPDRPKAPSPSGYEFKDWSVSAGGNVNVEYMAGEYITVTNNTVIRANWTNAVTIVFGTGTSSSQPVSNVIAAYGSTYQIPGCTYEPGENEGAFEYWYWGYKGVKYYPGEIITVTGDTVSGMLSLTAKFAESKTETYRIVYDPGAGSGNMAMGGRISGLSYTLPNCDFTAPNGYSFQKWKVLMVNSYKNAVTELTEKIYPGDSFTVTGDVYITAEWSDGNAYTITFDKGSGEGSMESVKVAAGSKYVLPHASFTPPTNLVFSNWDVSGTDKSAGEQYTVNADVTFTAEYASNSRTVTLDSEVSKQGTVSVFAKSNQDNTTGWSSIGNRAVWDLSSGGFTVYQGKMTNGNIGTLLGNIVGNIGFAVDGMRFTDSAGEEFYPTLDLEFERKLTDGTIQTAHTYLTFADMQYYTIYFVDHGFTTEKQYIENTRLTREVCEKPSGTNFNGWYIDSKYVNRYDYNVIVNDESDGMVLYARYTYVVTLDNMNGTSFKMHVSQEDNGALLSKTDLPDPVWEGYDFKGWCKDKDRIYGWAYQSDRVTEDMTLYARWSGKEVRVYFWYDDEDGYQRLLEKGEYEIIFLTTAAGNAYKAPNPIGKDAGETVDLPQLPSGYEWYLVKSSGDPVDKGSSYTVNASDVYASGSKKIYLVAMLSSSSLESCSVLCETKYGEVPAIGKSNVPSISDTGISNANFKGWKLLTGSKAGTIYTSEYTYDANDADTTTHLIMLKAVWEETAYDLSNAYQMSDSNNIYPTLRWGGTFNLQDPYHGKSILDYAKEHIVISGQFVKWTVVSPYDSTKHIGIYSDTVVGNKVMTYVTEDMLSGYDNIWDYYINTMRGTPYERIEWVGDGPEPNTMEINLKAQTTNIALKVIMDVKEEDKPLKSTITIEDPQEFLVYPNGPDLENTSIVDGKTVYHDEYGRNYYEGEKLVDGEVLYYWNEERSARYYYDSVNDCWSCVYISDLNDYQFSPENEFTTGHVYYNRNKGGSERTYDEAGYGLIKDKVGNGYYFKSFAYRLEQNSLDGTWREVKYAVEWSTTSNVISKYMVLEYNKIINNKTYDVVFGIENPVDPNSEFAASFYLKDNLGQKYKVVGTPAANSYDESAGRTFSSFKLEPFVLSNSYEFNYQLNNAVRNGYTLIGWHNDYISIANSVNPSADVLRTVHITTDSNGYAKTAELLTYDQYNNFVIIPLLIGNYVVDPNDADVDGKILIVNNGTVSAPTSYNITAGSDSYTDKKEGFSVGLQPEQGYSWMVRNKVIGDNEYTVSDYYADAEGNILIKSVSSNASINSYTVKTKVGNEEKEISLETNAYNIGKASDEAGIGYVWKVRNVLLPENTTSILLSDVPSYADANGLVLIKAVPADSEPIAKFNVYKAIDGEPVLLGNYSAGDVVKLGDPGDGNVWRIGSSDTVGYTVDSEDADAIGSIILKKISNQKTSYNVKINNGTAHSYEEGTIVSLPNLEDDGDKKFIGWIAKTGFIEDEYVVSVKDVWNTQNNTIIIEPVWSNSIPTTYTVVFVTEHGTLTKDKDENKKEAPESYSEDTEVDPDTISKLDYSLTASGYILTGWKVVSGNNSRIIYGEEYAIRASDANDAHRIVMEAIWAATYSVYYKDGAGAAVLLDTYAAGSAVPLSYTNGETYRVSQDTIQKGGSLKDASNNLTLTYRANWEAIDYRVHLTQPSDGQVDLFLENRDGKGGITYVDGSELDNKKFYYGDKIQLSYTPNNDKVRFIKWIITGEYYISNESDPNATLVVQGGCSIAVDESTGSIIDVMISFDNGDEPNDGNLNASDLYFTRVLLKDKIFGEYYEMKHVPGLVDMEHYTVKVPYGDYDLCIWYGWSLPEANGESVKLPTYDEPDEYILTGVVSVEMNGTTTFIYDVISAGFVANEGEGIKTFVDSEYGTISGKGTDKYKFLFGDNEEVKHSDGYTYIEALDSAKVSIINGYDWAQRADQYMGASKTKSNNYTRIVYKNNTPDDPNDDVVIAKITKYVGASRTLLKSLDARGLNINNPSGGTPPVVITYSPNQTYTAFEGFPWYYQGSADKFAFTLESDLNLVIGADSNSSTTQEFYLNWVRTDSPADVVIQIAASAEPDNYVLADVKIEKEHDFSHDVHGQWKVWNTGDATNDHYSVDSLDAYAGHSNIIVLVEDAVTLTDNTYTVVWVGQDGKSCQTGLVNDGSDTSTKPTGWGTKGYRIWGSNDVTSGDVYTLSTSDAHKYFIVLVEEGFNVPVEDAKHNALYNVLTLKKNGSNIDCNIVTGMEEGYETIQTNIRYSLTKIVSDYYQEKYTIQTYDGFTPIPVVTNQDLGTGGETHYDSEQGLILNVNTSCSHISKSATGTDHAKITIYHMRMEAYYILNDNTFANPQIGYDEEVINKAAWSYTITLPSTFMSVKTGQETSYDIKGWYLWGTTLEQSSHIISGDLKEHFVVVTKKAYADCGLSGTTIIKITKDKVSYETGKTVGYSLSDGWYVWGVGSKRTNTIDGNDVYNSFVVLTKDLYSDVGLTDETVIELGDEVAHWRVTKPGYDGYYIEKTDSVFKYEVMKSDATNTGDFTFKVENTDEANEKILQQKESGVWVNKYRVVLNSNGNTVYAIDDTEKQHRLDITVYTHWTCKAENVYKTGSAATTYVYTDNRLVFIPLTTTETVKVSFVTNYMTFSNGSQRMTFTVTKGGMFSQYDHVVEGTEIVDEFIADYLNAPGYDYVFKGFYTNDGHSYGTGDPFVDFVLDSDMIFVADWEVNESKKKVFVYKQDGSHASVSAVQDAMIDSAITAGKPTKLLAGTEVTISINPELGYTVDIDKTKGELGKTQVGKEIYLDVHTGSVSALPEGKTFHSWKLWGTGTPVKANDDLTEVGDDLKGDYLVYEADFGVTHSEKYRVIYVNSLGTATISYQDTLDITNHSNWKLWGKSIATRSTLGHDDVIDGFVVLVDKTIVTTKTNMIIFVSEFGTASNWYELDHYYEDKYGSKYYKVEPDYVYRYEDYDGDKNKEWVDYKYTKLTGKDGNFIKQYVHVTTNGDTFVNGYVYKVTRDDEYSGGAIKSYAVSRNNGSDSETYSLLITGNGSTYYVKSDGSIYEKDNQNNYVLTNMAFFKKPSLEVAERITEYKDFFTDANMTTLRTPIYGAQVEKLTGSRTFYCLGDKVYKMDSNKVITDMSGQEVDITLYSNFDRTTAWDPAYTTDVSVKVLYGPKTNDPSIQSSTYMMKYDSATGYDYLYEAVQYAASYVCFETQNEYYDATLISGSKYKDIFGTIWVLKETGEFMVDTVTVYAFDPQSSDETPIEIKYNTTTGEQITGEGYKDYPDQYYMKDQYGNHVVGNYLVNHKVSTLFYEKPDGTIEKLQVKYISENEFVKALYTKSGDISLSTDKPDYYIKKNGQMVINNDRKDVAEGTLYQHANEGFVILTQGEHIPTSSADKYSVILVANDRTATYYEYGATEQVLSEGTWKVWGIGDGLTEYKPKGSDAHDGFIVLVQDSLSTSGIKIITVTETAEHAANVVYCGAVASVDLTGTYKISGTSKTVSGTYTAKSDDVLYATSCCDKYISDYSITMIHAKYNQRTEFVSNGNTYLRDAFGNIFEDWLGTPTELSGNRGYTWTFLLKDNMDLTVYTKKVSYNIYFIINGVKVNMNDLNAVSTIPTITYTSQTGATEFYGTDIPQYAMVAFDGPASMRDIVWYTDPSYTTEYSVHNSAVVMNPTDFQPDVTLPDTIVYNTSTSTGWKLWSDGDTLDPMTKHKPEVPQVISKSGNYFYVYTATWDGLNTSGVYYVVLASNYGTLENNLIITSNSSIELDSLRVSGKTFQGWKVWNTDDAHITYNAGTGKYTYDIYESDSVTKGGKNFIILVADWGEDITKAYNIVYASEQGTAPNMESIRKYQFLSTENLSLYAHFGSYVLYLHNYDDTKEPIMYQLSEDDNRRITIPSDHFSYGDYVFVGWAIEDENGMRKYTYVPEESILASYLSSDVLDLYPYYLSDGSIVKYYDGKEAVLELTLDETLREKEIAPEKGQALVVRYSQTYVTSYNEQNSTETSEGIGRHVGTYHTYYYAQIKTAKGLYSDVYNDYIVLVDKDNGITDTTTVLAVKEDNNGQLVVSKLALTGSTVTLPTGNWKVWGIGTSHSAGEYQIQSDDKHNGFVVMVEENVSTSGIKVITIYGETPYYHIAQMQSGDYVSAEGVKGWKVWNTGFPTERYMVPIKDTNGNTSDGYTFTQYAEMKILQVDAYVIAPSEYMREGDGTIKVSEKNVTTIGLIPEDYTMSLAKTGGYGTTRSEPGVTPTKVNLEWNGFIVLVDAGSNISLSTYAAGSSEKYNVVTLSMDNSGNYVIDVIKDKAVGDKIEGNWLIWGSGDTVTDYKVKAADATLPNIKSDVMKFIVLVDENVGYLKGFTVVKLTNDSGITDKVEFNKHEGDLIQLNGNVWKAWGNIAVTVSSNHYTLSKANAEGFMWDQDDNGNYYYELDYNLTIIEGSLVIYSEDSSKHEYVGYS